MLSRDTNQLITIAKTKENAFDDFKFHLVVHDIGVKFRILCHSVIPNASQCWNHQNKMQLGQVVKVVEYPISEVGTLIWTVVNSQDADGGIKLLLWKLDVKN